MRVCCHGCVFVALFLLPAGCGDRQPNRPDSAPPGDGPGVQAVAPGVGSSGGMSDLEKVRASDVNILFIGNSHTVMHDLPGLVCRMVQFRHPGKKVYAHFVGVPFLEDAARDPRCKEEIESRPWKFVVLQAQKISASGRFDYSRKEGIEIAKVAKGRGAAVFFFSEWGLQGVAGDGPRTEKIYREMARAAGVGVAPVGRAWDLALQAGRTCRSTPATATTSRRWVRS